MKILNTVIPLILVEIKNIIKLLVFVNEKAGWSIFSSNSVISGTITLENLIVLCEQLLVSWL